MELVVVVEVIEVIDDVVPESVLMPVDPEVVELELDEVPFGSTELTMSVSPLTSPPFLPLDLASARAAAYWAFFGATVWSSPQLVKSPLMMNSVAMKEFVVLM